MKVLDYTIYRDVSGSAPERAKRPTMVGMTINLPLASISREDVLRLIAALEKVAAEMAEQP